MNVNNIDRYDVVAWVFWIAALVGPGLAAWHWAPRPRRWWFGTETVTKTVTTTAFQTPWWVDALGLYGVLILVLLIITVPVWGPRP